MVSETMEQYGYETITTVLILVVVEDGLRVGSQNIFTKLAIVLILVVVEDGLRDLSLVLMHTICMS